MRLNGVFFAGLVTGLAAVLLSVSVRAHLPEYFGRRFVLEPADFDERNVPPPPCAATQERESRRRDAEQETQRLKRRMLEEGVYSPGLADALGELAGLYAANCNHPAALRNFRDAVQRLRISEGLLTKSQLPYLKAQARSSLAIGDSRSAQLTMRQVFRIQGLGQGELDEKAVQDSLEYFAFARRIFVDPRRRGDLELFFQAFRDNQNMLQAQESLDVASRAQLDAIAMSQLYNYYLILGTDLAAEQSMSTGANAFTTAVYSMQKLAYSKGLALIERMLKRNAKASAKSAAQRARLLLEQGNWHMWNGKSQSACASYVGAWALAEGETGLALRRQLQQPAELPEAEPLWRYLLAEDLPLKGRLEASFLVSARGDVSAMDAEPLDDGSEGAAFTVGRWLRDSHMRPAVVDGSCVDSGLRGRRYRLFK
ncbi:MAG: hypothetical protein Cons2KO_14730 [Congregibacter sp.]